jgi:hypothetical protein
MGTCHSEPTPEYLYFENLPAPPKSTPWPKYPKLIFEENKEIQNNLNTLIFFTTNPTYYEDLPPIPNFEKSLKYIIDNKIELPKYKTFKSPFNIRCVLNVEESLLFMFKHGISYLFNIHIHTWVEIVQMYEEHGFREINATITFGDGGEINRTIAKGVKSSESFGVNPHYWINPLIIFSKDASKIIGIYYWDYTPVPGHSKTGRLQAICEKSSSHPPIIPTLKDCYDFKDHIKKQQKKQSVDMLFKISTGEHLKEIPQPSAPSPPL